MYKYSVTALNDDFYKPNLYFKSTDIWMILIGLVREFSDISNVWQLSYDVWEYNMCQLLREKGFNVRRKLEPRVIVYVHENRSILLCLYLRRQFHLYLEKNNPRSISLCQHTNPQAQDKTKLVALATCVDCDRIPTVYNSVISFPICGRY